MATMAKLMKKRFVFPFVVLFLLAVGGVLVKRSMSQESSPVSRGEALAVSSGCFACHGMTEDEGRVNFRSNASGQFKSRGLPTFWENGIESGKRIKEWIREGVPEDEKEKHSRLLIQMPAYGSGRLDESEIEAIAAWILAKGVSLGGAMGSVDQKVPEGLKASSLSRDELLVYGDRLARQQACYQCHGEFGQGGIANIDSFKGYIPGFFGGDFLELTEGGDRGEILHWIDHGRGLAVESGLKGKLAKRYFDGQATGMPGYEGLLSESDKSLLVDYLLLLNEMGPWGSAEIESFSKIVEERVRLEFSQSDD